jgi:hypothetical protein
VTAQTSATARASRPESAGRRPHARTRP